MLQLRRCKKDMAIRLFALFVIMSASITILSNTVSAASATAHEIEHLLEFINTSPCTFIRNGEIYAAEKAHSHIKRKFRYIETSINSAEEFIELVASRSSLSGAPYKVTCKGKEQLSSPWLHAELLRYRQALRKHSKVKAWYFGDEMDQASWSNIKLDIAEKRITVRTDDIKLYEYAFAGPIVAVVPNPKYPMAAVFIANSKLLKVYREISRELGRRFSATDAVETVLLVALQHDKIIETGSYHDIGRDDWSFDVWSPDGNHLVLVSSSIGPISVYDSENILNARAFKPVKRVDPTRSCHLAHFFRFDGWNSDNLFRFRTTACGMYETYSYDIQLDILKQTGQGSAADAYVR